MALDPYALCPCGSGKKLKWCCLPIQEKLDQAFDLLEANQIEQAIAKTDEIITENPDSVSALAGKATLLMDIGRLEQAEQLLQKALAIEPNFARGRELLGVIRAQQGKSEEAVREFRRAAETYHPNVANRIAILYLQIAEVEYRLSRPLAAKAAYQLAQSFARLAEEQKQVFEQLLGPNGPMPDVAIRDYEYKPAPADLSDEHKGRWEEAVAMRSRGKLAEAAHQFEVLAEALPQCPSAYYNLALTRAWQGENNPAIDAIEQYARLETDPEETVSAWALAELLRVGAGVAEERTDYLDYCHVYQIVDGPKLSEVLGKWDAAGRLVAGRVEEQDQMSLFSAILTHPPKLTVVGSTEVEPLRFAARLLLIGPLMRLSSSNQIALAQIAHEMEEQLGNAVQLRTKTPSVLPISDVLSEADVFFAVDESTPEEEIRAKLREGMREFFEEIWVERPLRSLKGRTPREAAKNPETRLQVAGIVRFLEDCAKARARVFDVGYRFDSLRESLGLDGEGPKTATSSEIGTMDVEQLQQLETSDLSTPELEQAWQAAQRLNQTELGAQFAKELVGRDSTSGSTDRFPYYRQLIEEAWRNSNWDEALQWIEAGEKSDTEMNEGKRRDEYELFRGRTYARIGDVSKAEEVFERLIARMPQELRFHGIAAEAMLSARQPERARRFVASGLELARQQKNRDSEEYFLELDQAAERG